MRPQNGAALYVDGEILPGYEVSDCARTGAIDFKFSVTDNSNGEDTIFPIPLVIINP